MYTIFRMPPESCDLVKLNGLTSQYKVIAHDQASTKRLERLERLNFQLGLNRKLTRWTAESYDMNYANRTAGYRSCTYFKLNKNQDIFMYVTYGIIWLNCIILFKFCIMNTFRWVYEDGVTSRRRSSEVSCFLLASPYSRTYCIK